MVPLGVSFQLDSHLGKSKVLVCSFPILNVMRKTGKKYKVINLQAFLKELEKKKKNPQGRGNRIEEEGQKESKHEWILIPLTFISQLLVRLLTSEDLYVGNVKKMLSYISYASVVFVFIFCTLNGDGKNAIPKF